MAEAKQNLQSTDVIAKLFGLTTRRIQQLTKEGVIQAVKVKGANQYDLLPTIQAYIKYLSDKANGREQKNNENTAAKEKAEADLKTAKAEIAQLQLDELKGRKDAPIGGRGRHDFRPGVRNPEHDHRPTRPPGRGCGRREHGARVLRDNPARMLRDPGGALAI